MDPKVVLVDNNFQQVGVDSEGGKVEMVRCGMCQKTMGVRIFFLFGCLLPFHDFDHEVFDMDM